ncbi:cytochrome c3 family protein [Limisalsivibrio acetivorans]|uniref:cytochrome c3 family protein n=1 Tax=Limisalsivibrio acetivorans TaxID=1304888 RepID=UPI0003B72894|nr:cytochrome c3 family protein [Limisalsivibrio acetivorans]
MSKVATFAVVLLTTLLMAFAVYADKHPEGIDNSMDCAECHQDVTPDVVQEWNQSAHGYTGVKCGVCHGDVANFRKSPGNEVCQGCHAKQVENNAMAEKKCSSCHPVHNYTVHKQNDYK